MTSVDRVEPELNDWRPGEARVTSTPRALATVVRRLTVGDLLRPDDRRLLNDELGDSLTGAGLVRAGVPAGWRVGDKSGTASYGSRNNVAVVHPPVSSDATRSSSPRVLSRAEATASPYWPRHLCLNFSQLEPLICTASMDLN